MPKMYDNLRSTILASAKEVLLKEGYELLTIRDIAGDCGIAVGTMYNYFPSKEMLAAAVMLEDWLLIMESMKTDCLRARTVRDGLASVYSGVTSFYDIYHAVWSGYTFSQSAKTALSERHVLLVRQLAEIITSVFSRLGQSPDTEISIFFAENILICASSSELTFDAMLRITEPILNTLQ